MGGGGGGESECACVRMRCRYRLFVHVYVHACVSVCGGCVKAERETEVCVRTRAHVCACNRTH